MKKLICVMLSVLMTLSLLAGCQDSGKAPAAEEPADDMTLNIAIVQQLDHASLDEIRLAIEAQMTALAEPTNYTVTFKEYNGQNDASMLNQIGTEIASGNFDIVIPIATLAAQTMVTALEDSDMPIVYAACSDPAGAGLTGLSTVTGVSDALNTPFILDMMLAVQPDVKTVGLLYSNSEINSQAPIAEAKAYLDAKGIAYVEKTGNNANEVIAAASDLVGRVDAVFTPTDNTIMASEAAVAEILNEAGIPHYTGADSFVAYGAFTTCGVNYTELGTKVADMAFDILQGGEIGEFVVMDGGIITVNSETAELLNLDYSVFKEMANTLITVTTSAE